MRRIAAALMLVASTAAQAQTYDPVEILPSEIPVVPTTTQPVPTNLGDDATREIELGFTFNYFGQDFTKAWISSNGFVSFQSPENLCCNGQPLDQAQRNTIYQYWTDLINWTGTPYYSKQKAEDGTNSLLVGWYNTYEYGNNKPTSFEMYLYDTGSILFNYIETYDMRYHTVTAGLTGPTYDDNISLFYGSNTGSLSGKVYSFNYSTGTVAVDCNISPMDPSCVSTQTVTTVTIPTMQEETVSSQTTVQQVVEQQVVQQQEETQTAAVVVEEQAVSSAAETTTASSSSTSSTTTAASTTVSSSSAAARLSPEQLVALNSKGASSSSDAVASTTGVDAQQTGPASSESSLQLFSSASSSSIAMAEAEQQQKTEGSESKPSQSAQQIAGSDQPVVITTSAQEQSVSLASISQQSEEDRTSVGSQAVEQSSSSVAATESRWQESLSSQSATLEALNSFNTAQGENRDGGEENSSLGDNQAETISQMAYVPGFSAYKLVTLPDRPEFYKPRRIYKNNRPVDAYMSIFKMTAANDNLWKQMVESQYE